MPKALFRGTLGTVATTATPAAGKQWIVTNIVATNTGAAANLVVDLDGIRLVHNLTLEPGALFTLDCAQVLEAGDALGMSGSVAAAISIHISGVEMDVAA